jgi:hypothetical protein
VDIMGSPFRVFRATSHDERHLRRMSGPSFDHWPLAVGRSSEFCQYPYGREHLQSDFCRFTAGTCAPLAQSIQLRMHRTKLLCGNPVFARPNANAPSQGSPRSIKTPARSGSIENSIGRVVSPRNSDKIRCLQSYHSARMILVAHNWREQKPGENRQHADWQRCESGRTIMEMTLVHRVGLTSVVIVTQ